MPAIPLLQLFLTLLLTVGAMWIIGRLLGLHVKDLIEALPKELSTIAGRICLFGVIVLAILAIEDHFFAQVERYIAPHSEGTKPETHFLYIGFVFGFLINLAILGLSPRED